MAAREGSADAGRHYVATLFATPWTPREITHLHVVIMTSGVEVHWIGAMEPSDDGLFLYPERLYREATPCAIDECRGAWDPPPRRAFAAAKQRGEPEEASVVCPEFNAKYETSWVPGGPSRIRGSARR